MKRRAAAALGLAVVATAPAHAQSQEIVSDMAGAYQIIPTDGGPACEIQLTAERVGQAWRARPEASCATRVQASAAAVAWRPMDGIVLLDRNGRSVMTFVEDETGLPSSPNLQSPAHYLVPRIAGYTRLPEASELVGKWTLQRRGRPPCHLVLTATPAWSSAPRRAISLGAGCAGAPLPQRLTRWSTEGMKIMLWGPGDDMLALEPVADNRYVAAPGGWVLSR